MKLVLPSLLNFTMVLCGMNCHVPLTIINDSRYDYYVTQCHKKIPINAHSQVDVAVPWISSGIKNHFIAVLELVCTADLPGSCYLPGRLLLYNLLTRAHDGSYAYLSKLEQKRPASKDIACREKTFNVPLDAVLTHPLRITLENHEQETPNEFYNNQVIEFSLIPTE